ncbi:MAG TPA: SPOR domain-containing protein [Candidatus Kapabacteria bacterium]|nr:SPOR domain-containing protein [Candidatus Kapabacteria bacterium]
MKSLLSMFLLIIFASGTVFAQRDEVNKYLLMVAQGKTQPAKDKILELLAKYPDDPGVKLLHATIIENAYLAMDIYKGIIKDYSNSEWADDAQWRIIQFYSIVGDTLQANKELSFMRTNYSNSPFLGPANDVVRLALGVAKSEIRQTMDFNRPVKNNNLELNTNKVPVEYVKNETTNNVKTDTKAKIEDSLKVIEQKAKEEIPSNTKNSTKVEESIFYGLQVAIFADKNTAENEKNKFLAQRMRTQVVEKNIDTKQMYAVVIGHYSSMESAEAAKIIVAQQCKCDPIIYKK